MTPHHHLLHLKEHDKLNVFFIFSRLIAHGGSTSTSASSHTHLASDARDINFNTPARDAATGGREERAREGEGEKGDG